MSITASFKMAENFNRLGSCVAFCYLYWVFHCHLQKHLMTGLKQLMMRIPNKLDPCYCSFFGNHCWFTHSDVLRAIMGCKIQESSGKQPDSIRLYKNYNTKHTAELPSPMLNSMPVACVTSTITCKVIQSASQWGHSKCIAMRPFEVHRNEVFSEAWQTTIRHFTKKDNNISCIYIRIPLKLNILTISICQNIRVWVIVYSLIVISGIIFITKSFLPHDAALFRWIGLYVKSAASCGAKLFCSKHA